MNIAITGHASGIGKGVFEFYTNNCMGFDLTNGYNIETDIDKILKERSDKSKTIRIGENKNDYLF